MGPHAIGGLKVRQEFFVLLGETSLYRSPLPGWEHLGNLFYAEFCQVCSLMTPICELFLPLRKLGTCFLCQRYPPLAFARPASGYRSYFTARRGVSANRLRPSWVLATAATEWVVNGIHSHA